MPLRQLLSSEDFELNVKWVIRIIGILVVTALMAFGADLKSKADAVPTIIANEARDREAIASMKAEIDVLYRLHLRWTDTADSLYLAATKNRALLP